MGRLVVFAVLVLAAGSAPAAGQAEEAAGAQGSVELYVPADARFPPGLIDWAELYANPVLDIEPVGFGTVAFERRSFERSVASLVLMAVSAFGVYVGLRGGLEGNGWRGRPGVHALVQGPGGPSHRVVGAGGASNGAAAVRRGVLVLGSGVVADVRSGGRLSEGGDGGEFVMRAGGGLRRLAALAIGGVLIVFVVGTRPEWRWATGRVVPAPPGGRPHLVEVVEPEAWLPVTAWTDSEGRFFLFMAQVGAAHTLRVERAGCGPAVVRGVRFEAGRDAVVSVPAC